MPAADIVEIRKAVIAALGASSAWGAAIDDDRRALEEINHQVVSADADVIRLVLETDRHPLRSDYMVESADLNHGDKLPASIGPRGRVEIKVAAADANYKLGEPASRAEIELWRRNPGNIYGALGHDAAGSPIGGFFKLEGEKIYFTGSVARVLVGAINPNYAAPACQAPAAYTPAVETRTLLRLAKEGEIDTTVFDRAERAWALYEAMIRAGILQLERAA